jgi:hypothetical protein
LKQRTKQPDNIAPTVVELFYQVQNGIFINVAHSQYLPLLADDAAAETHDPTI